MDGAIILSSNRTKIGWANVRLMPDPTILSLETGTGTDRRAHLQADRRPGDRRIAGRSVVSLFLDGAKYILEDIPVVLAKANQALATLDKYRSRLDQVSTRLTALEFEGGVTLHDVLTVLQRSELVTRMAMEIERYIVELAPRAPDRDAARGDDGGRGRRQGRARPRLHRRAHRGKLRRACWTRWRGCRTRISWTSAGWPSCSATTASSTRSTTPSHRAATAFWAAFRACRSSSCRDRRRVRRARRDPRGERRGARGRRGRRRHAGKDIREGLRSLRRSTSWTGICKPNGAGGTMPPASTRRTSFPRRQWSKRSRTSRSPGDPPHRVRDG